MTLRIGAVWMFLNLAAAIFLGAECIVQEIRNLIDRRNDPEAERRPNSIPPIGHRA